MSSDPVTPLLDLEVEPGWVDYNGHMNDAAYALAFSRAGDVWMDRIGLGPAARQATGHTIYTLQVVLHYFREARLGAPLRIGARLLEHDLKRARLWMEMRSAPDAPPIAASEQLYLSVDQSAGARAAPWRPETLAALEALARASADQPPPPLAGRGISLKRV